MTKEDRDRWVAASYGYAKQVACVWCGLPASSPCYCARNTRTEHTPDGELLAWCGKVARAVPLGADTVATLRRLVPIVFAREPSADTRAFRAILDAPTLAAAFVSPAKVRRDLADARKAGREDVAAAGSVVNGRVLLAALAPVGSATVAVTLCAANDRHYLRADLPGNERVVVECTRA